MTDHTTLVPSLLEIGLPVVGGRVSMSDAILALVARGLDAETARATIEARARGAEIFHLDTGEHLGALESLELDGEPGRGTELIVTVDGREHRSGCDPAGMSRPMRIEGADGAALWLPRVRSCNPAPQIAAMLELVMGELAVGAAEAVPLLDAGIRSGFSNAQVTLDGGTIKVRSKAASGRTGAIALADLTPRRLVTRRVLSSR